jgi:hypothetical protein
VTQIAQRIQTLLPPDERLKTVIIIAEVSRWWAIPIDTIFESLTRGRHGGEWVSDARMTCQSLLSDQLTRQRAALLFGRYESSAAGYASRKVRSWQETKSRKWDRVVKIQNAVEQRLKACG